MAQATKNGSQTSTTAKSARGRSTGTSGRQSADSPSQAGGGGPDLGTKARGAAIATGAALAGLAGGIALSARRDGAKRVLGMTLPARSRTQMATKNLADATKHVASFADQLGELAQEVRKVRSGIEAGGDRAPIEVLLQGLTRR